MNRVGSARSSSTLLLLGVALIALVIWISLQQVGGQTESALSAQDRDRQVTLETQKGLAKVGIEADRGPLLASLQEVVNSDKHLIAIRIQISGWESVIVKHDSSSSLTPLKSEAVALAVGDHQINSLVLRGPTGPIGKLDFYHQGQSVSGSTMLQDEAAGVPVWPLLLVLTISVLLCIAQWGRIVSKMQVSQGIPKRVRHSIDMLSEGLLVMDKHARIILTNRAFRRMTGLRSSQLIGKSVNALSWDCSEATNKSDYPWSRARDNAAPQIEQLMRYRMPDGAYRFFSINSSPVESPDDDLRDVLSTFRDVTDNEQHRAQTEHMLAMLKSSRDEVNLKNRELQILATQDAMTGCMNRRAFFEKIEVLWRDISASKGELACLMVDCDHFKKINDQYGHHIGDDVLRVVSEILRDVFDDPALVCRYGGEEFCIVMPSHRTASAALDAEIVRREVEAIRLEEYPMLKISVSIGISDIRFCAAGPQELINQADRCLYVAKRNGRNQVVKFSESVQEIEDISMNQGSYPDDVEEGDVSFRAVTALVSALAYRDYETAEHSRRVADLCVRLADGLLSTRDVYLLEIAALLHDIGKIGVADEVLLKPAQLSEAEWTMMREHERIGLEIISCTFNCDELFEILRTYRADYRGQLTDPHLPSGNDIPLTARLLKLADAYDAMISSQRYRPRRTHEDAIKELKSCAGTQFDPALVEHFEHSIQADESDRDADAEPRQSQASLHIGLQVEKLADALDARDVVGLQAMAARLAAIARQNRMDDIASVAEKITADTHQGQLEWITLLQDAQSLLNLCRANQIESLTHSTKLQGKNDMPR